MGQGLTKNILFLGVGLYNYDHLICKELSKAYNVSYIYLVPIKKLPKWKYSLLTHLNQNNYLRQLNARMVMSELDKLKAINFDIIFVIKGSRLEQAHMDFINTHFHSSKKVLYLWDAWSLIENQSVLRNNFNLIYSFDSEDCNKYGFKLRPLFYTITNNNITNKTIDISFIGTDHSNRLEQLRSFRDICKQNGLNYFLRLKTTGYPLLCAWFGHGRYKRSDLDILTSNIMTYEDAMNITKNSKVVIDFAHTAQCGLTIRTLEALALGCKLITTNTHIKEYSDISPETYCVVGESNEYSILNFISKNNSSISLPSRYSLSTFLSDLLG